MPELRLPTARAQSTQFALPTVQKASTAVQVSAQAAMAPGRGLQKMGESIAKLGQQTGVFFEELNKKKQGAEDLAAGIQYEKEYNKFLADTQIEASQMVAPSDGSAPSLTNDKVPDYISQKTSEWQSLRGKEILSMASPESALKIEGGATLTTQSSNIAFRKDLELKRLGRLSDTVMAGIDDDIKEGSPFSIQAAYDKIDNAHAQGLPGFQEPEKMKKQVTVDHTLRRENMNLKNDPKGALDAYEAYQENPSEDSPLSHLEDDQIDELVRKATTEFNSQGNEAYNEAFSHIERAIHSDRFGEEMTPEERDAEIKRISARIQKDEERGLLTPTEGYNLRNMLHQKTAVHDDEVYGHYLNKVNNYVPAETQEGRIAELRKFHSEISSADIDTKEKTRLLNKYISRNEGKSSPQQHIISEAQRFIREEYSNAIADTDKRRDGNLYIQRLSEEEGNPITGKLTDEQKKKLQRMQFDDITESERAHEDEAYKMSTKEGRFRDGYGLGVEIVSKKSEEATSSHAADVLKGGKPSVTSPLTPEEKVEATRLKSIEHFKSNPESARSIPNADPAWAEYIDPSMSMPEQREAIEKGIGMELTPKEQAALVKLNEPDAIVSERPKQAPKLSRKEQADKMLLDMQKNLEENPEAVLKQIDGMRDELKNLPREDQARIADMLYREALRLAEADDRYDFRDTKKGLDYVMDQMNKVDHAGNPANEALPPSAAISHFTKVIRSYEGVDTVTKPLSSLTGDVSRNNRG
jgi:hypothetical protein